MVPDPHYFFYEHLDSIFYLNSDPDTGTGIYSKLESRGLRCTGTGIIE
jgi:hypothetical protein